MPGMQVAGVALVMMAINPTLAPAKENLVEDVPAIGVEAYIYGYPLVTMEMTRRVMTNVAKPRRHARPDGPVRQACATIRRDVPRRHRPQRRHALHDRLARRRQGALGAEPARLPRPLLPVPDARRLDRRLPGARQAHHRHRAADLRHHRPGLEGHAARRASRSTSRPTAIVWLLGRIYCTGTPEDYAAVHALQDEVTLVPLSAYGKPYTPPAGTGRSVHRHEDAGARPGQRPRREDVFQLCWPS